ncbi:hypothetical protein CONCODRAFT_9234 [Conidiobolus coronatus NRRL 28638]|uniref:Zn(2)-C6 fungal-type domain-containing protein n=1 Tax=Conidiobolus coronatus (strain ATCC 28846 / CBS 209.66 / NRRL 28638) TaxID=796925 RepID=A0A137P0V0_CONC2|nr:hypothetical protein CONCODRAFT_9234 [Conidiobolus coronatus NRRL 28638]|eukprot:KXN68514.1 hypothetical protein CONCODRAFT_9234 [Conidiobolus coronatus NRRL 28638]
MFSVFQKIEVNNTNSNVNSGGVNKQILFSCFECRVSKQKCDKKYPTCQRCNQLKLKCRPYERNAKYSKLSSTSSTTIKFTANECKMLISSDKGSMMFNSMLSSFSLANYKFNGIADSTLNLNTKSYTKLMSLLSSSSDVVVLRSNNNIENINLTIINQDPTIQSSFWEGLIAVYFTEVHIIHPLFSLNNFSLAGEYWLRTNLIYYLAYEFSSKKSPIANIKMKNLLLITEHQLNTQKPNLLTIQCYILLYIIYQAKGELQKKRVCFHKAMKIAHLIGLRKKCSKISAQNKYERFLSYTKLIELYWGNRSHPTNKGLLLELTDFNPDFSEKWQLTDPLRASEEDKLVAKNISLNAKFVYLSHIYITNPFVYHLENEIVNYNFISKLESKLDGIFSDIKRGVRMNAPYSNLVSSNINLYYLMIKQQLNSVLLKEFNSPKLQAQWIKLNFDLVKEYKNSKIKSSAFLIVILMALKSIVNLKDYINSDGGNLSKINELVCIMTNLSKSSDVYKAKSIEEL